ncbi:MAG: ribonuclease P protein component [Patescibacteria group bacterium]|jgi:ribonuclease P protein component
MLAKKYRISKKQEFEKIFKNGKKDSSHNFIIRFMDNDLENCRFSVIVSNKISGKATERNKIRRRAKAIISDNLSNFRKNIDLLIIALLPSKKLDFANFNSDIVKLLVKNKII